MRRILPFVSLICLAVPAHAADDSDVPYWASLSADVVNMRVGPARDYRIAWVYKRKLLPVKVVRKHEGWRLVEDPDGAKGWILSRFLSRKQTAIVREKTTELRESPGGGRVMWRAEPGVVGKVGDCESGWCKFDVAGRRAWVSAKAVWGEGTP